MTITHFVVEDWEAVYLDDVLLAQDHRVSLRYVLEELPGFLLSSIDTRVEIMLP